MDILDHKLNQYQISEERNIPFENMTSDYKDISDFIHAKQSVVEMLNAVKQHLDMNENTFSAEIITTIYLQKLQQKFGDRDFTDVLDEINYYLPIDKFVIQNILTGKQSYYTEKKTQIETCKKILPTTHSFEVMDLKTKNLLIEITYSNDMNEIDFFNQVETSEELPIVLFMNNEHSLCKQFTMTKETKNPLEWFSTEDTETKNEIRMKYQYAPIKSISCRVKKTQSKVVYYNNTKKIIVPVPVVYISEKENFIKGLTNHFHGLKDVNYRETGIIATFILKWSFNNYYFYDMIFNTPEINSLVYMDESSNIFTKKKSFNLNFVLQSMRGDEKVQVSINHFDSELIKDDIANEDDEYTIVKIKNVKNLEQAEMFKNFLLRIFAYYESKKDEIQKYYKSFGVHAPIKQKKKKDSTSEKKEKWDKTIFPDRYARRVQGMSQPKLVAKEKIGDKKSEENAKMLIKKAQKKGYIVMKWPTIVEGHPETIEFAKRKVNHYFRAKSLSNKYPGLKEDGGDEVPFLLQFNKKQNLIINDDWSVKITAQHRSPKGSIPILVNAKILFQDNKISHQNFDEKDYKHPYFSYQTLLISLLRLKQSEDDVKDVLSDMIKNTQPSLLKQQYWNKTIPEIKREMKLLHDNKIPLVYNLHVKMIEEYFNINLFCFTFDEHNLYMQIPEYKHLYVYEEKNRDTVCVIQTEIKTGIPHYKVILLNQDGFVSDSIRNRLFDIRRHITRFTCEPILLPNEWDITGQIIDFFGKTRVLELKNKNDLVQIELPRPMEPLNIKEVEYKRSTTTLDPFTIYKPVAETFYEVRKKISKVIKEFGKLLYFFDINIEKHFVIMNVNYNLEPFETRYSIPFMRKQKDVVEHFKKLYPFLFYENQMMIENETIMRGLMSYIKTNRYTYHPTVLKDMCSEVSDFDVFNPYEVIFVEQNAIVNASMINQFKTHQDYVETEMPYFYSDSFNRIFLFQNVYNGDYNIALRILSQWNTFKINTGFYSIPLFIDEYVEPVKFKNGVVLPNEPGIGVYQNKYFFFAPLQ